MPSPTVPETKLSKPYICKIYKTSKTILKKAL